MKTIAGTLLVATALVVLGGCGASDNSTAQEGEAFKHPDKASAMKGPPPGAMTAPSDFHSSISGPGPGGGAPAPGPGGK